MCIAAAIALAAEPRADAFAVGIMRRDGILVPYATFDGSRWAAAWPQPQTDLQVPVNVESVPKAWWGAAAPQVDWQFWPADGGPTRAVTVTETDWIDVHCRRQVGLRTDYRALAAVPPPTEQPYPKDGLVVAPARALEPIEVVAGGSPEGAGLLPVVAAAFNNAEAELAFRFPYPADRGTRERLPVTLEAIYAFGASPRWYYVESARSYRASRVKGGGCATAFGTGWFVKDGAGVVRRLDMAVDLLSCDLSGATFMLPLGVLRAHGRAFWTAQYSGWDHERYMVIEVKRDAVQAMVSKWGGGC